MMKPINETLIENAQSAIRNTADAMATAAFASARMRRCHAAHVGHLLCLAGRAMNKTKANAAALPLFITHKAHIGVDQSGNLHVAGFRQEKPTTLTVKQAAALLAYWTLCGMEVRLSEV